MAKEMIKGNVAVAEAAVRAGLVSYFGYPITPQTELLEYLSARMPELGRAFVQAESELGAINMVYGAACTGLRTMSSSSSPGVSLMTEGISYIYGTEVPAVLVDVMRGGPGLGNISPSQADYTQVVHGGGHGEYHLIVLAPASVQEAIDLTAEAFDLAEKYRTVAVILMDGFLGQMMEPAVLPPFKPVNMESPDYAVAPKEGREKRFLSSINIDAPAQERLNIHQMSKWEEITRNEVRYEGYFLDDAEYVVVGFGTCGRIALTAVRDAREKGIKIGLLRPVSLSPYPTEILDKLAERAKGFLVVEMNNGQMLEDVVSVVARRAPVHFYGRMGGTVPYPDEISQAIDRMIESDAGPELDGRAKWLEYMRKTIGQGA
ncbi:MAG TPA: 3-methyl-2-oxobutanoate dehydrogenase subunit VorB [Anaerolineaceae bacterium]|nr:3-methyl-2-oxobutanoate dehydrogenase subunit VorB [Anaerolineaceae bacterium]